MAASAKLRKEKPCVTTAAYGFLERCQEAGGRVHSWCPFFYWPHQMPRCGKQKLHSGVIESFKTIQIYSERQPGNTEILLTILHEDELKEPENLENTREQRVAIFRHFKMNSTCYFYMTQGG